jgi:hypothetical protein
MFGHPPPNRLFLTIKLANQEAFGSIVMHIISAHLQLVPPSHRFNESNHYWLYLVKQLCLGRCLLENAFTVHSASHPVGCRLEI